MAFRTPMCRSFKGGYKDVKSPDLLTAVMKAARDEIKIDPAKVDDIVVGTVHTVAFLPFDTSEA
jgi:acetyl-CoA acyltransferase 1